MTITCLTCRVLFSSNQQQKDHYKHAWHHYNTSRKIVGLEPITFDLFAKIQEKREEELNKKRDDLMFFCNVCRKTFNTKPTLDQHLQSRKHRDELERQSIDPAQEGVTSFKSKAAHKLEQQLASREESEADEDDEDEWEDLNAESLNICECLFCPIIADSVDGLIKHLGVEHSFFLNDVEYCVDVEALLRYLGELIKIQFRCIRCSNTKGSYNTLDAVQKHMISKGHCRMKTELGDILEYAPFYDYSQTYPDEVDEDEKDAEFDANELTATDNWQLVLPSGAIIGHRSLRIYYKQKFRYQRESDAKPRTDNKRRVCKIMTDYKALGWTGGEASSALVLQKRRDMQYFAKLRQSKDFGYTTTLKNKVATPRYKPMI